ncbi:MAG TPA: DNA mismatch repair protein MutS [bacterium]|nr:DNA mismatch repair protein MutS [bacterium]
MEKENRDTELTPMLKQYYEIKSKYKDCILFFRLGDFYEMFNEDAKIASQVLGLALTRKPAGKGKYAPLAGLPFHSYENYIYRLIKKGYKVAICEQLEDPSKCKGIVQRGVIRIVTPGTVLSESVLQEKDFNFLCSFNAIKESQKSAVIKIGLCLLDLSTGKFVVTEFEDNSRFEKLETELNKFSPSEYILPDSLLKKFPVINQILNITENKHINEIEDWKFNFTVGVDSIKEALKVESLEGYGCHDKTTAIECAGAVLKYIEETQMSIPSHITRIQYYNIEDYLILDGDTRRNLELTASMRDGSKEYTLLWAIDQTVLNSGGRLLKDWILNPLVDAAEIIKRQESVKEFFFDSPLRSEIRELLKSIYDIERIISKISCKTVTPKDLVSLKISIALFPDLKKILERCKTGILKGIFDDFDECADITRLIDSSIDDNPPAVISEGGIIKKGYNKEIDELRKIKFEAKDYLINLETEEKKRTGIQSLKIKYNRVFGYYIEISNANLDKTPDNYIRKQTLVNAERFITPELKEFETKALNAEEKLFQLEERLFIDIREKIDIHTERLLKSARYLAEIDVLANLAEIAVTNNYVCPEINNDNEIVVKNSRHPVIEQIMITDKFVENEISLNNSDNMLLIITGPNMAGKSTYIRQTALLVLMAQIGSFIPAKEAKIGVVDRIFTRVGASDNLARGQSTFMVEMIETANILNNATSRSLIILDEIGRGTSTFDGLSLAWSIAEFIALNIKAKTMFATHYHELIELAGFLGGVKNYNIAVREWNDKIIFLRKIVEGGVSRSYGIQVARLAGLPAEVISRAKEILHNLETKRAANPVDDMPLFNMGFSSSDDTGKCSGTETAGLETDGKDFADKKIVGNDSAGKKNAGKDFAGHSASDSNSEIRVLNEQTAELYNKIIEALKKFDLNSKSPVECLNFIDELKRGLPE